MQRYTVYLWKLLYMFRVVSPSIIRSTHNCIYSMWHLSNRYRYLPLSWKCWNCRAEKRLKKKEPQKEDSYQVQGTKCTVIVAVVPNCHQLQV